MSAAPPVTTPLDELVRRLRSTAVAGDGETKPAAILWTDPLEHWIKLKSTLLKALPELVVLGEYRPEDRTGPAIWIRCIVDGSLPAAEGAAGRTPIVYLPGVSKQHLTAGDACAPHLRPLVELMFRGRFFDQHDRQEWTLPAFLGTERGLGLDVSRSQETIVAMIRAVGELAVTPLSVLRGKRLESEDFDRLLTSDVVRDLLRWMGDPDGTRNRTSESAWGAFRAQCKARFGVDPDAKGDRLTAGERLILGEKPWDEAWNRFAEAPSTFPGIPDLLRTCPKPSGLFDERWRHPAENDAAEEDLRTALDALDGLAHNQTCQRVLELEKVHADRRGWVWGKSLGAAPMAFVIERLAVVATHVRKIMGGATPDEVARTYVDGAWRADAAAWQAMALASEADREVVRDAVWQLLGEWLHESAKALQEAVLRRPLPSAADATVVETSEGGCLFFADGLRYDVGRLLAERLEARGCRVAVRERWAAVPSVTATAKAAITPVARALSGGEVPADFEPKFTATGKPANAGNLRSAMEAAGYQILGEDLTDAPTSDRARGWMETGEIDTLGHQRQDRLAEHLDKEIESLTARVLRLLDQGWRSVRIVTDHGWLYLPGELPKAELPKHLTNSRWSRCASIQGSADVPTPTVPWHWNKDRRVAVAPGAACFAAANVYAHGGVSLQECLTPDVLVERITQTGQKAAIRAITWFKFRCHVEATATTAGVRADLRLGRADGVSVAQTVKPLDAEGTTSLLVADDAHERAELVLVLIGTGGEILAQRKTRVGESS